MLSDLRFVPVLPFAALCLNAPCGAGCFLTPASGNGVVAPLPGAGAPPAPQAPRGTGQHAPSLTTFLRPDAKRHRRPSRAASHQLPTMSSQKIDVPACGCGRNLFLLSEMWDFSLRRLGCTKRPAESVLMYLLVPGAFWRGGRYIYYKPPRES